MESIRQHRKIRKKIEQQFVTKHEKPENAWTHEGRYYYREGEIQTEPREPSDDLGAERRREHGHRTFITGPSLQPRHSVRSHIEREGDVEGAEYEPEMSTDPHTINTEETLGNTADIMLTGVERTRPGYSSTDSESNIESAKKNTLIVVTFEGDCDPMDPHNWSLKRRVLTSILTSLTACVIFWSSTIDATALPSTKKLFHTTFEVQTLPTAMFLIGTGVGALATGPISEVVGRTPIYIPSMIVFMLFDMGAGLSQTAPQRIVCRGLAGLFGSAPAILAAASIVDIWSRIERVYAFPIFAIITFTGPLVGPVPGAFAVNAKSVSWRWVDWMTIIFAGLVLIPVVLFLPETYSPILLYWKAKELRHMTGDDRYRSPLEFRKATFAQRMRTSLYRPFVLFVTEPIIMIHSLSLSLLFLVMYTFIAGFVSIYQKANHFSATSTALAFLGIEVGVLFSALTIPISMWLLRREIYRSRSRGQHRPEPEISLYMAMFGAPCISISLFWMAWTARLSISFWSPLVASVFFGFGTLCVFVSGYQYVADAFEAHAASALSCLQMTRLVTAGAMAIVAELMYNRLGVAWTLTLLGCLSLFFVPVPYLLYWKGHKIRSWSRHARGHA
ncbi:Major facilitator superfamily domain general substrate transporter [Penicillium cf. griseofulvum]|uniref:Major facilitator superfamily domain general substrate transporter n=1 Tax=Penicillium cf. griseofulvum TaxID=2972120 RepID=A0A9W9IXY7_9EURO|nr:Major facilitator superfamily domain general substrate transporter [Penicillium cf. griseofulvum]KAJ5430314.1 Major facilitator superfamily domain general substrate transporter [Penicillium cf. griseofulvum]KAJ5435915.1 Major facilitator superfamily domain general substrate transporter [Penicillium cf. griseofulvum]